MSTGLPPKEKAPIKEPVPMKPAPVKPKTVVLSIPDPVNAKAIKQIVTVDTQDSKAQDIIVPIGQKDICVEVFPTSTVTICSIDANGFKTQPLPLK